MTNILEFDSVILEFELNRVLQDVYLRSETGKATGLLGRNGSGKSCLLKILFGEMIPISKSIRLNGYSLVDTYRSPKDFRYLPQIRFVPNSLTVKRIMSYFELNFSEFILLFPEFEKYYKLKLRDLSGGERRIIEIYIILASKTKFCLLDEPFSHIMPIHIEVIKDLILREKENKGIILTDHMYNHILDVCDNVYVLNNGKTHLIHCKQDLETLGYARIKE